jgi:hypothetical protein
MIVNPNAMYGSAACAAEDAPQDEDADLPPCCCPGCGLTREEDEHCPTPCFFENCPMKETKQ